MDISKLARALDIKTKLSRCLDLEQKCSQVLTSNLQNVRIDEDCLADNLVHTHIPAQLSHTLAVAI